MRRADKTRNSSRRELGRDFVTLPCKSPTVNTSINSARSHYSVFSNSQKHLVNSQITSTESFLKNLSKNMEGLKSIAHRLKSPRTHPSKAQVLSVFNKIKKRKKLRKMTRDEVVGMIRGDSSRDITDKSEDDSLCRREFRTVSTSLRQNHSRGNLQ